MIDTPDFREGEFLTWENRATPGGPLTKRPVAFVEWRNHMAVVSFGLRSDGSGAPNLFSVSPSELVKAQPQHLRP